MVKLTAFLALVAPAAYVMAQVDIPSGLDDLIPSDWDIPTSIPTDPAAISSLVDVYDSIKTVLPTEVQSSLDSVIAEATAKLEEGESAGSKITLGISMAVTVGIVAAAGMLL
ncbi:hypothetical protein BJV82DRAFT_632234 [Fennellomyces sp. T-0311]|nr:hypothetical protein BJV82DRAFT_632234 [Fennellomyces sp. T-0311]